MSKTATIKILDEINIAVIGLTVQEYKFFYDAFGIFDKDYIFKPEYKLGRWDGKIRLFTEAGKTSIHFSQRIIKDLKSLGYKIKLIDCRNPASFNVTPIHADSFKENGVELAKHQVDAVNALMENRGGIVLAATGAGKSYMIGSMSTVLFNECGYRTLVIVPTTNLVLQTADEIKIFHKSVGMYYGSEKNLNADIVVSTWQSLQNNPAIVSAFESVIIDEAHGAQSNVLYKLIGQYAKKAMFICGVTGTLPKHEAERSKITYVLGDVVYEVKSHALRDTGWLASSFIHAKVIVEDMLDEYERYLEYTEDDKVLSYKKFKASYFPDYAAESNWIKANPTRRRYIASLIESTTEKSGNSFVLVNSVPYGKKLAKEIPNAIFVHGVDDVEVRKQIFELFSTNDDVIVIATYKLASTGINIKRIFNLFLLDAGKSFIQVIQSIGRGLRKAADKTSVSIYDISSDLKYATKHFNERKKFYVEEKHNFDIEKIKCDGRDGIDNKDEIVVY